MRGRCSRPLFRGCATDTNATWGCLSDDNEKFKQKPSELKTAWEVELPLRICAAVRLSFDVVAGRGDIPIALTPAPIGYGRDGEVRDILVETEAYVAFSSPSTI